jgi:hypothetical protein
MSTTQVTSFPAHFPYPDAWFFCYQCQRFYKGGPYCPKSCLNKNGSRVKLREHPIHKKAPQKGIENEEDFLNWIAGLPEFRRQGKSPYFIKWARTEYRRRVGETDTMTRTVKA